MVDPKDLPLAAKWAAGLDDLLTAWKVAWMDELWVACSEYAMADLKDSDLVDMSDMQRVACWDIVLVVAMAKLSVAQKEDGVVACWELRKVLWSGC